MFEDTGVIAGVITSVLVGLFSFYQYLRRHRKNGKAPAVDGQSVKRTNWKDAYADLSEQFNKERLAYQHDRDRDQQKIEVMEKTIDTLKEDVAANSQRALEFKIAREALDERNEKNTKLFAQTLQEQTVAYTTEKLQDQAKISDLSQQLTEALKEIAGLRERTETLLGRVDSAEKSGKDCQGRIQKLEKENGKLRGDVNILSRKLDQGKGDTDKLETSNE